MSGVFFRWPGCHILIFSRALESCPRGRFSQLISVSPVQRALTAAIQTGDVVAERVCVGNLGRLLLQGGTAMATAEDCIRR